MSLVSFFTAAITPVTNLIDELHTSDEEKGNLRLKFEAMQSALQGKLIELEKSLIAARSSIIIAEAQSQSWLASNWRPMLMLLFGIIIANNYILYPYLSLFFDAAPKLEIPPDMWDLLKLGVGGYIAGRSVEKGIKEWKSPSSPPAESANDH